MKFDSHVERLLRAGTGLVNLQTPGHDGPTSVDGTSDPDGVLTALGAHGRHGRPSPADVESFSGWAARFREVFVAADAGHVGTAARAVNALLADSGARPRLDDHGSEAGWNLHFHGPDDSLVVGWAAGIASALALVVGSAWSGRLGVCAADPCDRVFVDDSRNGTRRFCSTRCQNRVKAAAHRARRG